MKNLTLNKILETCIKLGSERNVDNLFGLIVSSAMDISNSDGGTLYLYDDDTNTLHFKILRTNSMFVYRGKDGEKVDLPPVQMNPKNVCSYAALENKIINIPDVYNSDEYDFSGPKAYDKMTGFKTTSVLVIPLITSQDELVGVLQLINAQDENGNVIPFSKDIQFIVNAFATQAAVVLTSNKYLNDIKNLLHSFVKVLTTAIEETSIYNVNHTKKIVDFGEKFVTYLTTNEKTKKYQKYFTENVKEQFIMSIWLHDIGKIITPVSVMNKATKLGDRFEVISTKIDIAKITRKIAFLEEYISKEDYDEYCEEMEEIRELITRIEFGNFTSKEDAEKVKTLKSVTFFNLKEEKEFLLTDYEFECLSIFKGTLTQGERLIMENHVVMTRKLLDNISFGKSLKDIPKIASMHHEFLDGSGYPNKQQGVQIPLEVRMLTLMDIFEALTSTDRPYKKSLSQERAFDILGEMVKEGKLDGELVMHFKNCMAQEA